MQKLKIYSSALILFVLFALSGCPNEDENLVNPPSQAETVSVRFINLAGDYESRSLRMTEDESAQVGFAQSTETYNPPDDSTKATVLKNGRDEFSPQKQLKFFRNLTYTFFAMPTAPGDSLHPLPVDTLIGINSSLTIPDVTNDAYVRLVNAFPDTNSSFSLVRGCAGGATIAPNLQYRKVSTSSPVLSGENTFSVIYNHDGVSESIGLFKMQMEGRGEYAFVIVKDQSGNPVCYSLDEKSPLASAFQSAEEVVAKTTNIRTINFSDKQFDLILDNEIVAGSPQKDYIGNYNQQTACSGTTTSNISAISGGDTLSNEFLSLEVLQDYSLYTFDEGDKVKQIIAPPFKLFQESEGKSLIRVVNGNPDLNGITVSFGARKVTSTNQENQSTDELSFGETIARNVRYGTVSNVGVFESGLSPITVFTTTQPAKYVTGINYELLPNKSYTIVVYKKSDGSSGFTIIEDNDEDIPTNEIEPGIFVQIVNGVTGPQSVRVGIDPILKESFTELFYSLNIATVIPAGQTNITINGKSKSIEIEKGKRLLIVANGSEGNENILTYQYDAIEKIDSRYRLRFLNASQEINEITITRFDLVNCPECPIYVRNLAYEFLTTTQDVDSEAKISLYVVNPDDFAQIYHRVDDLKLNFNKAYTVIFMGDSSLGNSEDDDYTNNGYSVVLIQEF